MSNKITSCHYIGPRRLTITAEALGVARVKLQRISNRAIPEGCFIDDTALCLKSSPSYGNYEIAELDWTGDDSKVEYLEMALAHTQGQADLLLVWEGARSLEPFTALRVDNGSVTRHEIVMTLGKPIE